MSGVLGVQNVRRRWHCGSSSLKGLASIHGPSNARNVLAPRPWWWRSPLNEMLPWDQRQQRRFGRRDRFVRHATCAAATGYEIKKWPSIGHADRGRPSQGLVASVSVASRFRLLARHGLTRAQLDRAPVRSQFASEYCITATYLPPSFTILIARTKIGPCFVLSFIHASATLVAAS